MLIFSKGLIHLSRWSFVLQSNRQKVTEREREYPPRMFLCLLFFVVNGSELSLNCVSPIVDSHLRWDDLLRLADAMELKGKADSADKQQFREIDFINILRAAFCTWT